MMNLKEKHKNLIDFCKKQDIYEGAFFYCLSGNDYWVCYIVATTKLPGLSQFGKFMGCKEFGVHTVHRLIIKGD